MNKQQIAQTIWNAANKMRSKIDAGEYKDFILGFIFYKYLSQKEVSYWKGELGAEDSDIEGFNEQDVETVKDAQQKLGYFIAYENLFSTWVHPSEEYKKTHEFGVGDVTIALNAFSRLVADSHAGVFGKPNTPGKREVFATLSEGLSGSKLGDTDKAKTAAVRDIIGVVDRIPMEKKEDYDVLGYVYEYLINNFAANAGNVNAGR